MSSASLKRLRGPGSSRSRLPLAGDRCKGGRFRNSLGAVQRHGSVVRGTESRARRIGWHGFRVGWSRAESKTTSKGAFISNAGDHGAAGGRTNFRTAFAKPSFSLLSVTAFAGAFTSLLESPIAMEKPPPQAVSIIEMIGLLPSQKLANAAVQDICQGSAFECSTDLAKALAEDSS
jgi:hypothetical protein